MPVRQEDPQVPSRKPPGQQLPSAELAGQSQQEDKTQAAHRPLVHAASEALGKVMAPWAAWCRVQCKWPRSSRKTRTLCKARFAEQDEEIRSYRPECNFRWARVLGDFSTDVSSALRTALHGSGSIHICEPTNM